MNLRGIALRLVYQLRRHECAAWPLSRWLGLLVLGAGLAALIYSWPHIWPALVVGSLYVLYLLALAWADRCQYVHFRPEPQGDSLLQAAAPSPPLGAEELVPVRASGGFGLERKHQYYMELEADFETVETREHIVLGRVHPSQFLLLGRWPDHELGWWYIFFQPSMIQEMAVGQLYFGARPRLALRIAYSAEEQVEETIYLTFEGPSALRRVYEDVLKDAPPGLATANTPGKRAEDG